MDDSSDGPADGCGAVHPFSFVDHVPECLIHFGFNMLLELTDGSSTIIVFPPIPHFFQSREASGIRLIRVKGNRIIFLHVRITKGPEPLSFVQPHVQPKQTDHNKGDD
jgi:hypothetical protein